MKSTGRGAARGWLHRHLVFAFVLLTYAWTWGVGIPAALAAHGIGHARISLGALTLAGFAPTIVALALLAAAGGRDATRDVWIRLSRAGAGVAPAWYVAVIVAPLVVVAATLGALPIVGAPLPQLKPWYTPFISIVFLTPLTGLFEEVGWRGLMLDRLEQRMSPLRASALVAAAWGPWHIPTYLRLMPEGDRTPLLIVGFLIGVFPLSILFAWVYNRTSRRLLPVILLHASIDASVAYFFAQLPTGELRPFIAWTVVLCLIAAVVLWREGPALGRPRI